MKELREQHMIAVSIVLWYSSTSLSDWCPTFADRVAVSSSRVKLSIFHGYFDPWRQNFITVNGEMYQYQKPKPAWTNVTIEISMSCRCAVHERTNRNEHLRSRIKETSCISLRERWFCLVFRSCSVHFIAPEVAPLSCCVFERRMRNPQLYFAFVFRLDPYFNGTCDVLY